MAYEDFYREPQAGRFVDENGNLHNIIDESTGRVKVVSVVETEVKGTTVTALDAVTASTLSAEIDCTGFNSLSLECDVSAISSGNWVVEIHGSSQTGGNFGPCWQPKDDGTFVQQKSWGLSANGIRHFYYCGIPNFIKLNAIRTTDGTLTAKVTPFNM